MVAVPVVVMVEITPEIYTEPVEADDKYCCENPVIAVVGQEMFVAIATAFVSPDGTQNTAAIFPDALM